MEHRWDLTPLYASFESAEFKQDIDSIRDMIAEYDKWTASADQMTDETAAVEKYIDMENELGRLVSKAFTFCSLTLSVETKNEKAQSNMDTLQKIMVSARLPRVRFQRWVKEKDIEGLARSSEKIKAHEFVLTELAREGRYLLDDTVEDIVARLSTTGGRAWSTLQGLLSANLMVEYKAEDEVKSVPLTVARNLAHSQSAGTRKAAYEGELAAYKKIEDSSAAALNAIKGEVLTMAELRGYESPLEMTLTESRMTRSALDAMMEAVREYLPVFRSYFRKKAEALGYKGGLKFYDLFAPLGSSDKTYSYEEARGVVTGNFGSFSPALASFAEKAFDENWIDLEPREGKRGGAFCSNIHPIGQSRILANFSGSIKNVITLAHELGHGYHGHCLMDSTLLDSRYPMPLAETASIFCETVVKESLLKGMSGDEKTAFLENALCGEAQIIVDIYSRYLFETELFALRDTRTLPARELKELMEKAQKDAYGDGLDPDVLHPYMWANKPHYYMTGRHFYNFPYTFGLLFATGLYAEYLKDRESFVARYDEFLRLTGRSDVSTAAAYMGIDVEDVSFWKSSLEIIKKEADEFSRSV